MKKLGLFGTLMISIGSMITAGIAILSGVAVNTASTSIIVSIVIAVFLSFLGAVCYTQLSNFVGKDGGVYEYVKETFSVNAGFIGGWLWIFAMLALSAAAATRIPVYITFLANITFSTVVLALISGLFLVVIALIINSRFSFSTKLLAAIVAINALTIILSLYYGIQYVNTATYVLQITSQNYEDTLFGAAVIFLAFSGFAMLSSIRSAIAKPEETMGPAAYLSIAVLEVCYVVFAMLTIAILAHAGLSNNGVFFVEAALTHSPLLLFAVAVLRITALIGLCALCMLSASKTLYSMTNGAELPLPPQKINSSGKPTNEIIVSLVFALLLATLISFNTLVESASAAMLLIFILVSISVLNLIFKKNRKSGTEHLLINNKYFSVVAIVAVLGDLALLLSMSATSIGITFSVLLVSGLYYNYGRVLVLPKNRLNKTTYSPKHSQVREFSS